jgi:hypothetical protein
VVRHQSGSATCYSAVTNNTDIYVERFDSGSGTTIAGPVTQSFASGDWIKLEVTGTGATVTLKVYKALAASPTSWTQVGTDYTDTSGSRITAAGAPGMYIYTYNGGLGIADWEGGNLSAGTTFTPRRTLIGAGSGNMQDFTGGM